MGTSAPGIGRSGDEGCSYQIVGLFYLLQIVGHDSWFLIYHTRMGVFPRWNGLKHFYNVTTIKFTDGQSFYDILKVSFFVLLCQC